VVGVPDRILGEKLCACVVSAPGQAVSLDDLVQFLRGHQRVAAYKLPEYVLQVDALPRNPVGKILKRELRAQALALAPEAA
jgi:acyl-CoA synthetase (AMP-forming)/AMP-acid ligase II